MSRSYRDIPPDHFVSRRREAMETKKRMDIVSKAVEQSQLLRRIRHEEAENRAMVKILFFAWCIADMTLERLENQRNEHTPKDKDDEWDEQFTQAVNEIPGVKRICNDLWFAYTVVGKGQFWNWI